MTDRYIGYCCREWILSLLAWGKGKCGLCGETPKFVRMCEDSELVCECDDCTLCAEIGFCECHDCHICGYVECDGHPYD